MILNRDSIKQILAVLAAPGRQTVAAKTLPCHQYTAEDCECYVDGQMAKEKVQAFESHCLNCLSCLEKLYQSDVEISPGQEKKENEQLFLKTNKLLNQLDQKTGANLLEMIIKVADKAVELISTTGLLLQNRQPVAVRSTEKTEQITKTPLRIMQEIEDSPYSLQATMQSEGNSNITLSVSIFNRDNEEFREGISANFRTPTTENSQTTDLNGEVIFQISEAGIHELTLSAGKEVIGRILLTMT